MFERDVGTTRYWTISAGSSPVTLSGLIDSVTRPVSAFRKPWSWHERAIFSLSQMAIRGRLLRDIEVPVTSSVPLHWQPLFNFLYREGVVDHPGFDVPAFRTDMLKATSVTIKGAGAAGQHGRVLGHAAGHDPDETISKALGEFLERYSATLIKPENCKRASIAELERRRTTFLDPRTLCAFSTEQIDRFERFRYDAETQLYWSGCTELLSNTRHLIPAQLAQYPFRTLVPDEPVLNPLTSNGMAGHFSRTTAILAGLKELIQRDAFLIYWLNMLTPSRINVTSVADMRFQKLLDYARAYRTELHFLDLRTDLPVPTTVCIAVARTQDGPVITVGAGNGATALEALERAYFEAIPALSLAASPPRVDPSAPGYVPFASPEIGKLERITLWRGENWLRRLAFWLDGPVEPFDAFARQFGSFGSPQAELSFLMDTLRCCGPGYGLYVSTMRNPIIDGLGYHVVQVRVPKLVPMYLNEHQAPLGAERLASVPAALGLASKGLNGLPHPFP